MLSPVVCDTCGHENAPELSFCGNCSSFLWTDDASAAPTLVAEPPAGLTPVPGPASDLRAEVSPAAFGRTDEGEDGAAPPAWFKGRRERPTPASAPVAASVRSESAAPSSPEVTPETRLPDEYPAPARVSERPLQGVVMRLVDQPATVETGSSATMTLVVRNTGTIVESFQITVRGLPAAWVDIVPSRCNLLVDAEETVTITVRPPRSPRTPSGHVAYAVTATSQVDARHSSRLDGTLEVEPFHDLVIALEPADVEGKRSGRTYLTVENRGNAAESVDLVGADDGSRLAFSFRPADVELRPGQRASVTVDVRARRRRWGGGERMRPFTITAASAGSPPSSFPARFTQLASFPTFVIPLLFAVLAVGVPIGIVSWQRAMNKTDAAATVKVPTVVGLTSEAAGKAVERTGLIANVTAKFSIKFPAGVVTDQQPAAGTPVAPKSVVNVVVANSEIPLVEKYPIEQAQAELQQYDGLIVDIVNTYGTDEDQGQVVWQRPRPGGTMSDGTIHLGVSTGRPAFQLGDYRGQAAVVVKDLLAASGLVPGTEEEPSEQPVGIIVGQNPAKDAVVRKGDPVTLLVSSGPAAGTPTTVVGPTPTG